MFSHVDAILQHKHILNASWNTFHIYHKFSSGNKRISHFSYFCQDSKQPHQIQIYSLIQKKNICCCCFFILFCFCFVFAFAFRISQTETGFQNLSTGQISPRSHHEVSILFQALSNEYCSIYLFKQH